MHTRSFALGVGLSMLLGAGILVGRVTAPADFAAAQPAAATGPAERWEMTCLTGNALDELAAEGRKLGQVGWELVTSLTHNPVLRSQNRIGTVQVGGHVTYCFKRRLP